MGKLKNAALVSQAPGVRKVAAKRPPPTEREVPVRYTYALAAFTAEIRDKGWYIARTMPSFIGEKPAWAGPFETIESAVLAIARRLATEIADRHTRIVESKKIKRGDPCYGLKRTTAPRPSKSARESSA